MGRSAVRGEDTATTDDISYLGAAKSPAGSAKCLGLWHAHL